MSKNDNVEDCEICGEKMPLGFHVSCHISDQVPMVFEMFRNADESGVSGTGLVLQGVRFHDETTVVRWCAKKSPARSTAIYNTFEDFKAVHIDSHPGNGTEIRWIK